MHKHGKTTVLRPSTISITSGTPFAEHFRRPVLRSENRGRSRLQAQSLVRPAKCRSSEALTTVVGIQLTTYRFEPFPYPSVRTDKFSQHLTPVMSNVLSAHSPFAGNPIANHTLHREKKEKGNINSESSIILVQNVNASDLTVLRAPLKYDFVE